jgi:hypothetical protein
MQKGFKSSIMLKLSGSRMQVVSVQHFEVDLLVLDACPNRKFVAMNRCFRSFRYGVVCVAIVIAAPPLLSQTPADKRAEERMKQQMQEKAQRLQEQMREVAGDATQLPTDPQLLTLHKEFISKAEKLAMEYERKKEFDKAREVYTSLVKLVPSYGLATDGLSRILGSQSSQNRKLTTVYANQAWQPAGVVITQGMPVHIEAQGTWKVVYETGAAGIEIPEELRPRDNRIRLGTLIGTIIQSPKELEDAKSFVIEDGKDFIAKTSGQLFLRMFDVDPSDNEGKLMVLIQSTFGN